MEKPSPVNVMYKFSVLDFTNQQHSKIQKVLTFVFQIQKQQQQHNKRLWLWTQKCINLYDIFTTKRFQNFQFDEFEMSPFFPVIRQLTKYFRPIPWIFPSMLFSLLPPTSISDRRVWGNKWSFKSHHFPNVIAKQRGKKMIEWETGYIQLLEEQIRFFFSSVVDLFSTKREKKSFHIWNFEIQFGLYKCR